jgi:hypothetical protein
MAGLLLGALIYATILVSTVSYLPGVPDAGHERPTAAQPVNEANPDAAPDSSSRFLSQSLGRPMINTSGRFHMWSLTMGDVFDNPLWGIGPMNYVCTSPYLIGHPHNFPLQLAAEWGIPVAIAACFIFLALFFRAVISIRDDRFDNPDDREISGLLLTGLLAAALHACLSGVMVMPASQVTGLLLCGMLLGLSPASPDQRPATAARWWSFPGLVLAMGLLALGVQELRTMEERASQLNAGETMWPRIWQNAKVCRIHVAQFPVRN